MNKKVKNTQLAFWLHFAIALSIALSTLPLTISEGVASTSDSERREGIPPRLVQGGTRVLPKLPHQLITDQN